MRSFVRMRRMKRVFRSDLLINWFRILFDVGSLSLTPRG